MIRLLFIFILFISTYSHNCSWDYRFDSTDNHFNIVYPDKNAVYFAMFIPKGSNMFTVVGDKSHPIASYFSIQIYTGDNAVTSLYHYKDTDIMLIDEIQRVNSAYSLSINLNKTIDHFAVFRIYGSEYMFNNDTLHYWSGVPPSTYVDNNEYLLCDIDYSQQGNIYTNISNSINPQTGTVCLKNAEFLFMEAPPGSLMNSDANYMIACIEPNTNYNITIKMPRLMCSVGFDRLEPHPYIDEPFDLRYASLSVVSTTSPRPTIETFAIPCDRDEFNIQISVNNTVPLPGLLYRQLLPDPYFKNSIAYAKKKCYNHVDNQYDYICIENAMADFYPRIIINN
jgi:hypothetical protein